MQISICPLRFIRCFIDHCAGFAFAVNFLFHHDGFDSVNWAEIRVRSENIKSYAFGGPGLNFHVSSLLAAFSFLKITFTSNQGRPFPHIPPPHAHLARLEPGRVLKNSRYRAFLLNESFNLELSLLCEDKHPINTDQSASSTCWNPPFVSA